MTDHRELEVTLEAPAGWEPPDLAAVPALRAGGIASAEELPPQRLDAIYHDTAGLRLLRRGVTLRRRTGDDEAGWHLKLPATDGSRTEIHRPLDPAADPVEDRAPAALATLVEGVALGEPLVPVARLVTRRRVLDLRDGSGESLAVVARDAVEATVLGDEGRSEWEEVEAEATGGDDALLAAVVGALLDAGARVASSQSKAGRALGVTRQAPPAPPPADPTAGDVLAAYVREHADRLVRLDPDVRRDLPDAVHQSRVATRRLRAALATFRPLLDREATEPLRDELRWWAGVLGAARDAEVRRDRLAAALDALPGGLVVGAVREDLVAGTDAEQHEAWRAAVTLMSDRRYLELLRAVEAFAADPPLSPRASRAAGPELRRHVRAAYRRAARRHAAALAAPAADRAEPLHEARKAAKRARYAAEAVAPVYGRDARRLARRMDRVQDALGTHRDAAALAERLRAAATRAEDARAPSFTYGVLVAGEHARAGHALEAHRDAWRRASARGTIRWAARKGPSA
ncbi:CYTH and CHAD domain-containing protein [Demequina soli]|uniref:CYTH and CHAD domain-containing protein n=1 Tax=Demequina soli TaxID=1638987 RepID=UPI0007805EA9|nr:CYTH and CHAD domain-containing protein [Demequina soli]